MPLLHSDRVLVAAVIALAAGVLATTSAGASQLLNGSGIISTPSFQFLNPSGAANIETNSGITYSLLVPGQYVYTDTFSSPQGHPLIGTDGSGSYGFEDSYQFSLDTPATGDILEASLSFGSLSDISNLQIRLYGWTTGTIAPTVGGVPVGATAYTTMWAGIPTGQSSATVDFGDVPSGNYILDVRGTADGMDGGFYTGQIFVTPTGNGVDSEVPLPAGLYLLLSGLFAGGTMLCTRHRRPIRHPFAA